MLFVAGTALVVVACVLGLVILINAFKESSSQGLLCMFVPFYIVYYGIGRYRSPSKGLVVGGWLGAATVGMALQLVGFIVGVSDAMAESEKKSSFEDRDSRVSTDLRSIDDASSASAPADAPAGTVEWVSGGLHCDSSDLGMCEEADAIGAASPFFRSNCKSLGGKIVSGSCPTKGRLGHCDPKHNIGSRTYYYAPNSSVENGVDVCKLLQGTWHATK